MGKLDLHREAVKRHLSELAQLINDQHPPQRTGIDCECVFDDERNHYLLAKIGWSGGRRVRAITLYVRLRNGKIWVEEDMTEEGIATALVSAGVPKEDIVLGFRPPDMRQYTEYAVA
jgi:hypothetical protein